MIPAAFARKSFYCLDDNQNLTLYGIDSTDYARIDINFLPCGDNFANKSQNCTYNQTEIKRYLGSPIFKVIFNSMDFKQDLYGDKVV